MNLYDNENKIIEYFQMKDREDVYFPISNDIVIDVFEKIYDKKKWDKWIDSSGKKDPPPDFYSDEFNLMMDVMRIDDHTFISENGKKINSVNAAESKLRNELKNSGILACFPNLKDIY